jgi:archaellum component FlaC
LVKAGNCTRCLRKANPHGQVLGSPGNSLANGEAKARPEAVSRHARAIKEGRRAREWQAESCEEESGEEMSEDQTQNLTSDGKLDLILQRLTALEAKAYDTKPIWERALAEIMEMNQRFSRVEAELRKLNSHHETLTMDLLTARSDIRDMNRRIDEIERPRQ